MNVRILMVDDHPSQIEGYKIILSYNNFGAVIETTPCYSCESAYNIITKSDENRFDIVFLDRSLPPYPERGIRNGEDLAILVKEKFKDAKVVIITSHAEAFLLYNILKKIQPEGLLVKSDFTADELLLAFETICKGENYYTHTVKSSIKELLSKEDYLDSYNRQIITLLSQGIKTRSLPEHLSLSLSAIEKRKAQIKDYLGIEKGSDEDIVREARRMGFI